MMSNTGTYVKGKAEINYHDSIIIIGGLFQGAPEKVGSHQLTATELKELIRGGIVKDDIYIVFYTRSRKFFLVDTSPPPKLVMFSKRPIGDRRTSKVYEGRQETVSGCYRDVAIKSIRSNDKNLKEVEMLVNLNHSNVVQIYDSGEYHSDGHWIYIVMERCSLDLKRYVEEKKLDQTKSVSFARQIASAVDFMHKKNIAHRNIKPSNIFISECEDFVKVSDSGIGKEFPDSLTSVTNTYGVGTDGYRAPETYNPNYKISLPSDIFSLGLVTAYLLSNGSLQFGDDPLDWSYKIRENLKFSLSQIPRRRRLMDLIESMLKHEPDDRPTAKEVLDICESCDRPISPVHRQISIVLFEGDSKSLHLFDPQHKSMLKKKFESYPPYKDFKAVSLHQYIYVLASGEKDQRTVYRLDCSHFQAGWEKMNDWPEGHGDSPPVVASSDYIFLIGGILTGRESKSVSKYNPSLDRWERLNDKPRAVAEPILLCTNDFVYCIGGRSAKGDCERVGRMDLKTMTWSPIAEIKRPPNGIMSAVEYGGRIYAFSVADQNHCVVASWDPKANQWSEFIKIGVSSTPNSKICLVGIKALVFDGNLYLFSERGVYKYDVSNDGFSVVTSTHDQFRIEHAVLVNFPSVAYLE